MMLWGTGQETTPKDLKVISSDKEGYEFNHIAIHKTLNLVCVVEQKLSDNLQTIHVLKIDDKSPNGFCQLTEDNEIVVEHKILSLQFSHSLQVLYGIVLVKKNVDKTNDKNKEEKSTDKKDAHKEEK